MNLQDQPTNIVAAGAVVSPFWLPYLKIVSDVSALFLPIAGLIWLLIQMYGYIKRNAQEKERAKLKDQYIRFAKALDASEKNDSSKYKVMADTIDKTMKDK